MNKYKKIAAIAVTAVMAGSMIGMMAACTPTETDSRVQLRMNIGNNNNSNPMGISYRTSDISGSVTMADGVSYSAGDLKPAWARASEVLNINFIDAFENKSSNNQIIDPITQAKLGDYDVISGSLQTIVERADSFLNLTPYLDSMPNYKAFLEANPVVQYSLTADGSKAMYAAPYFDGLNDIEKYELFNKIWVEKIIDAALPTTDGTITFLQQAKDKSIVAENATSIAPAITAYMGSTDWEIDTTNRTSPTETVKVKVSYSNALAQAKLSTSDLYAALDAVEGVNDAEIQALTSGNIVDIMNMAIEESSGAVKGSQLIAILRAYIPVAYLNEAGTAKFYATSSDVFNGIDAAWDVDLLAALSRCVVTSQTVLGSDYAKESKLIYGIAARQATTQRRVDLITLAGTLYGFRGADNSRYEYAYIGADGNLKDSRVNTDTYECLNRMYGFTKEGLLATSDVNNTTVVNTEDTVQAMMIHDYAQTQTTTGLGTSSGVTETDAYNFSPVVTPVSKWDTNDDGTHETTMRFTESWRSVKNTGFCVPKVVADDARKLDAVLNFIDYLFSADGQILMTYGYEADNADYTNGWWEGKKSTLSLATVATQTVPEQRIPERNADGSVVQDENGQDVIARTIPAQYEVRSEYLSQVFVYNGQVYEGVAYNGRVVPKITNNNSRLFLGYEVNGSQQNKGDLLVSAIGNYTNYARRILGTTLPIGNKDQGFEYQCTAACALTGAANVSAGLVNGTIKHIKLSVTADEGSWYLVCPTALPLEAGDRDTFKDETQTLLSGQIFLNNSSTTVSRSNMFIDYIFFGFESTTRNIGGIEALGRLPASASAAVNYLVNETTGKGMNTRLAIMQKAWNLIKTTYGISTPSAS